VSERILNARRFAPHVAFIVKLTVSFTFRDFFTLSASVFPKDNRKQQLVGLTYYANLILVLANYVLTMSKSIQSMIGRDKICLPECGLIAFIQLIVFNQNRRFASLGGGWLPVFSIGSVVVVLLVSALQARSNETPVDEVDNNSNEDNFFKICAACSGIAFAVGSQKLLLNIRQDLKDKKDTVPALQFGLVSYCLMYVLVAVIAGNNPPGFLLDAVENVFLQKLCGLLLWSHVSVSFAINNTAFCSSIKYKTTESDSESYLKKRWFLLTTAVTFVAWLIANSMPFFADLVSLIGGERAKRAIYQSRASAAGIKINVTGTFCRRANCIAQFNSFRSPHFIVAPHASRSVQQ